MLEMSDIWAAIEGAQRETLKKTARHKPTCYAHLLPANGAVLPNMFRFVPQTAPTKMGSAAVHSNDSSIRHHSAGTLPEQVLLFSFALLQYFLFLPACACPGLLLWGRPQWGT